MRTCLLLSLILACIPGSVWSSSGYDDGKNSSLHAEVIPAKLAEIDYGYEALDNGTIRFTVHNNSSLPLSAEIIREAVVYPTNGVILVDFRVLAGESFTYIDDSVTPGHEYMYIFEYKLDGDMEWQFMFDYITAVSTIPALGTFNLYVPPSDEDYDWVRDGMTINISNTVIRASASDDGITNSVVFFLNGKRSLDNTYPFTLFGDVPIQASSARLKNGSYSLVAIAYPLKHGKGIPGDTAEVNFVVDIPSDHIKIDVTPNPIIDNAVITLTGDPVATIRMELVAQNGTVLKLLAWVSLGDDGQFKYTFSSAGYTPGVYILRVRCENKTVQRRILIKG